VSGRISVECSEHLETEPLIERSGLEAVGFEGCPNRAPRPGIRLRRLHQPSAVPLTAHSFSDPQMGYLQPATPDLAEGPAQHVAVLAAQDEVDREVVGRCR